MGRNRTGYIRERNGRFEVEIADEFIGTYETRAKAERMRAAALAEDAGTAPSAFKVFATDWFDRREIAARKRGRARPFAKERSRWRAHVESAAFFELPMKKLTPRVFQTWIGKLSETEAMDTITFGRGESKRTEYRKTARTLSRKVIQEALNLVQLCLDEAITMGLLPGFRVDGKVQGNPARMVLLPREESRESDGELIPHLSPTEIDAVFALELTPFQRAVFAVAIYAGLRRGEIWGLRWQDLLLDGVQPELRVRFSYTAPTKTRNSRRDVPLLQPAITALKAWREAQPTRAIGGLVFPNPEGKCFSEGFDAGWRDKHQRLRDKRPYETKGVRSQAGIRAEISFKELRHTTGCGLAQGFWTRRFDLHEIKTWLGHSSIAVTERHYARLCKNDLHDAVSEAKPARKPRAERDE